jgi:DNA invertase Pin-like site-specific DNA recombinase
MIITKIEKAPPLPSRRSVAAYARVSDGKDSMLRSLSAQVSHYADMIQRDPRWEYVGVFADEAITGTKDNRAEFKRLIEMCRAGGVDLVITKSISRFARNTLDLLMTVRELKSLGVDVYFEEQNIHTLSAEGELMLTVLASYAQAESLSVSENCKWRIKKRYERGENVNWRYMYGYDISKNAIHINEAQAEVVSQIFADYIGGMGASLIARKLNDQGIPAYLGGEWRSGGVMNLIRNEKYMGDSLLQKKYVSDHLSKKLKRNRGDLPMYYSKGTHAAIIDADTFELAQKLREERASTIGAERRTYPFTGKMVCGICGKHYKRKKGVGRFYWQCSTYLAHGKSRCAAKQIPESTLYSLTDGLSFTRIDVIGERTVEVLCSDGSVVRREWDYRSRSESWTEEMRETASARQLERSVKQNG